ncbi:DUF1254 domain-containing protein [Hoeflea sp. G2-23]|uniref:DUF1254 domain-containing protein n=1 Tax=Hoeflea algicola TaxID=2983763 RepID=A0ABT3Z3H6_9HYPH|nr:DUF1254 domain-containing protein [Hoeflea algicola]MCY0146319.1 DUF1254 domain-containing protein [Hoeflea algicola]
MRSGLLAIAIGLVGAALIHIIIILAMPKWTGTDTWTRVVALGDENRFFTLANEPNTSGLYNDDPYIRTAVCRFDIDNGPVRVMASGDVPLWTVSVYDSASNETYSMNDRSSIGESVDIAFVTPTQMLQLRRAMPRALERAVLVELPATQGYVALRAIAPAPSQEPAARAFLADAICARFKIDPA